MSSEILLKENKRTRRVDDISLSDLQGFIMSGIISKYEKLVDKTFESIRSKFRFDFDEYNDKLEKATCFLNEVPDQYLSRAELPPGEAPQKPSPDDDRYRILRDKPMDRVVSQIQTLLRAKGLVVPPLDAVALTEELRGVFWDYFQRELEVRQEHMAEESPEARRYRRMGLGKTDEQTGLRLPMPDEVPASWTWEHWKQEHPNGTPKDYIMDENTWGALLKAGLLYQDQLKELDFKGLQALRNWCAREGLKVSDIVPAKKTRIDKELQSVEQLHPALYSFREYRRLREALNRR